MGLDMVAYSRPRTTTELARWRKHPNLHGWMETLWRCKTDGTFNCVELELTPEDIDALEKAVLADELPPTTGFFFGESLPEDKEQDLQFIAAARAAFHRGEVVLYNSWW